MRIVPCLTAGAFILPILVLASCGGGKDEGQISPNLSSPGTPGSPPVTITIGNLTDATGVSANQAATIDMGFGDMVDYYNQTNLIDGVVLKIIKYDTQYNPSNFIPGYRWLRERGADLMWNSLPPGVPSLQAIADEDRFPIFSATANVEPGELDGSYIFCLGVTPVYEAFTFLDWVAKNDPDFPRDRPARIGGAAWNDSYSGILFEAAEEYCAAHPDQYDWVKGYLTEFKFTWGTEVEGLKDCDYVFIPAPPHQFVKAYRQSGYAAKFLGTEVHAAFIGMIDQAGLWNEIDGMLLLLSAGWYNDNDPVMNVINRVLDANHSVEQAEEIRTSGSGYRAAMRAQMVCDIIREASSRVGPENLDTEAIVDAAKSWSFSYGTIEDFSNFTETKRFSQNYYGIFRVNVEPSNTHHWQYIIRADPAWVPQVTSP